MSADGSRARRVLVGILLFAVSAAYFGSYARIGLFDDEGYLLQGVTRILGGEVIHRDFHHTYAPGGFYLFAALFRIFGESLLVVRVTWVALRAAIVVIAWIAARRLIRGPLAWGPPLALLALPGPWHKSFFHLFFLATLAAGIDLLERGGAVRSFATGVLVGAALLFRQDVGIFAAAAIGACLLLRAAGRRTDEPAARVSIPLLAAGLAVVLAPTIAYFASQGALGPMLDKLGSAGIRDNSANALPFPPLLPIVPAGAPGASAALAVLFAKALYFVPPATFAAFALLLAARAVTQRKLPSGAHVLLLLLGSAALLQAAARSDLPHVFQAIGLVYFPWAIGAAWLVGRLPPRLARAAGVAGAIAFPVALTIGVALLTAQSRSAPGASYLARSGVAIPFENASGARVGIARGPRVPLALPRGRILVSPEDAALLSTVGRFLDAHTKPGDYVLTLPGFQLIYFLFDRRNPTPYPHVRRAFDSPAEEDAYIASIDRHGTRYVLFEEIAIDGKPERRFAVYSEKTMNWLTEHFRPIDRLGRIRALERIPVTP